MFSHVESPHNTDDIKMGDEQKGDLLQCRKPFSYSLGVGTRVTLPSPLAVRSKTRGSTNCDFYSMGAEVIGSSAHDLSEMNYFKSVIMTLVGTGSTLPYDVIRPLARNHYHMLTGISAWKHSFTFRINYAQVGRTTRPKILFIQQLRYAQVGRKSPPCPIKKNKHHSHAEGSTNNRCYMLKKEESTTQ